MSYDDESNPYVISLAYAFGYSNLLSFYPKNEMK